MLLVRVRMNIKQRMYFSYFWLQVFYWGGGKQTPHKVDMFQGGHSALQVNLPSVHFLLLMSGYALVGQDHCQYKR